MTTASSEPSRAPWWPYGPELAVIGGGVAAGLLSVWMTMSTHPGWVWALVGGLYGTVLWLLRRQRQQRDTIAHLQTQAKAVRKEQAASLAVVEHEIRSSLNGITGYAEYVSHQASDPMMQFTGTIIYENSLKLARTTDVLLHLIHRDAAASPTLQVDFSLTVFFESLRREFASALHEKTLLLECRVDPELPDPLHGQAQLVRKVIANLTENAIRFCDTGGRVRLHAELAHDHHHVHVRVEDDGPLISHAILHTLLACEPPALLTRPEQPLGDAGVSLAVAHRLALSMGGRLHHTPTLDKGNMFHFFFPLPSEARPA